MEAAPEKLVIAPEKQESFSLKQRIVLSLVTFAGHLALRIIGPTLRVTIYHDADAREEPRQGPAIYCFWHRCVFPAAYIFRNHQITVLTSRSYDGEYIARIIKKFGFSAVRGSSSRGALSGLRGMQREVEAGKKVAFTIDGPRGPRYVAKQGPVAVAKNAGGEIVSFYVAPRHAWILNSWDHFLIPKPFSKVAAYYSRPLPVPRNADEKTQADCHRQMQAELERVQREAESRI